MARLKPIVPVDPATLNVRVDAIDSDLREVKDSILGLDAKIEKAITDLAREMRTAVASLATQFSERQRTPWGVIYTGIGVLVAVLGFVGGQALSPMHADIKALKEQIVPRDEINYRTTVAVQRFETMSRTIDQIQTRRYDELIKQVERLAIENGGLRAHIGPQGQ